MPENMRTGVFTPRAARGRACDGALWISAALLATAFATSPAWAQIGTGTFRWELSADNGATWSSDLEVDESLPFVRLRAVASWSVDAGRWFAFARFDVAWRSLGTLGRGDSLSSYSIRRPFDQSIFTAVGSRFDDVLKIDDSRDTLPPGAGPRGFSVAQLAPVQGFPDDSNPVALCEFVIALDGTRGERTANSLFIAPNEGNTLDRFMLVYTTTRGATNKPSTALQTATLRVIPSPTTLAAFAAMGLLAPRRRCRQRAAVQALGSQGKPE